MNRPINLFEYESQAPEYLSKMALDYYASGAGDEVTLRDNRAAFDRVKLRPRMLADVSERDLSVKILGEPVEMPILIAPMAFQCLAHPEGELATARAAQELGAGMVLSTLSTKSLEAVASIRNNAPQWFQLYVHRDRALTSALVERSEAAGFAALCLTADAPLLGRTERDIRNQFSLPPGMEAANLAGMEIPEIAGESGLFAYVKQQLDASLTWRDDVLKALALGADAVLIGRPILWGLAVGSEAGARHVLELLRDELDLAMALSGCAKIKDIDGSLVRLV